MRNRLCRTLVWCGAISACIPIAGPAAAGPWARDQGQVFLAYSLLTAPHDPVTERSYVSAYLEYGIADDFTLAGSLGSNPAGDFRAVGVLRTPPATLKGGVLTAMELGLGLLGKRPAMVPGLSLGRGVTLSSGATGWWTLDARALLPVSSPDWDLEAEITLGINSTERLKLITQIQTALRSQGPPSARWETLAVWEIRPGHHLQAGINLGLANSPGVGFKLGLWHRF